MLHWFVFCSEGARPVRGIFFWAAGSPCQVERDLSCVLRAGSLRKLRWAIAAAAAAVRITRPEPRYRSGLTRPEPRSGEGRLEPEDRRLPGPALRAARQEEPRPPTVPAMRDASEELPQSHCSKLAAEKAVVKRLALKDPMTGKEVTLGDLGGPTTSVPGPPAGTPPKKAVMPLALWSRSGC